MNILFKPEKPSGGAAVQAYGWIRGLIDAGQDVRVLTHVHKNQNIKEECADLAIVPLYDNEKGIRWLRWVYYRFPYLYRIIKTQKPDYFYESVPCWKSFLFGLLCHQLGVKYVLRISNDCFLDERARNVRSRGQLFFQRLGMKLSYCILCQNNYQYDIVKKQFPNKRVFKITNPLLIRNNEVVNRSGTRDYIAWIGIYQYQKNLPLLYEIASALTNEKFLIAGKEHVACDANTRNSLEQLSRLPNVEFVGFLERDQVLPFFAKAKYLLNTSHYEGFSNTFLEAMSVSTPIITSERVNPDNIVTTHHLGIVFKDLLDLQQKIFSITPQHYHGMATNISRYIGQHDYKKLTGKLLDMLENN